MLRNILLVAPLFAFGLSLAASQPSAARPLAGQSQQARWCTGDGCGSEDDDGDACEDSTICIYGVLDLCGEDRQSQRAACSNTCAQLAAKSCAASLGAASPDLTTCTNDLATRCASDCTRPQTLAIADPSRGGSHPHNDDHDDDDHDGCNDDCVTLEIAACITISHE